MSEDNIWIDALEGAFSDSTILRASELQTSQHVKHKDVLATTYTVTMCFFVEGGFDGLQGVVLESQKTGGLWVVIFQPRTGKNNDPQWVLVDSEAAQ